MRQPSGAQAELYRFDRGRPHPDGAVRAEHQKLSLELGGNAPVIVFDDANLDAAVAGIMASKFRNSGQTCVCANRIYVQDGIYERLAEKLVAAVEQLKVGDGSQKAPPGPLIDSDAVAKVQSHIDDALIKGAQIATGGQPHALGGTFFQPTVVTGVTQKMRFAKEETFGPVAPLFRFHDEAEAIAMANDTEFGGRLPVHAERRAPVARAGGTGVRHGRHQHRADFQRSGAVRRREAVRARA